MIENRLYFPSRKEIWMLFVLCVDILCFSLLGCFVVTMFGVVVVSCVLCILLLFV